ncbi:MAG TPA: hypothetical protein VGL94_04840 [Ktedonobacteraceae bacterium]|jgi:hypothetical protein
MKSKFKQRLQYTTRLQQGETPEAIFADLTNLLQAAEAYADRNNHQQALDIYAQVINAHLATNEALLISLFDRAIIEFLPQLDMLLFEASSLIISEPSQPPDPSNIPDSSKSITSPTPVAVSMSPLLTPEVRRSWLERLFALWLKRIDISQIGEQLQEIIFEVAWSEDMAFLRHLVESELQHNTSSDTYVHGGDSVKQSHTRTLEQFLQQLLQ